MNEMMIDLETLDVQDSAVIYEAAFVVFNSETMGVKHELAYNFDAQWQIDGGRTVSAQTIEFHCRMQTSSIATGSDNIQSFQKALMEWADAFNVERFWAKGSQDFAWIKDLFRWASNNTTTMTSQVPWKFYQVRDLRTLMSECGVPKGEVAHTALADCHAQIAQLAECRDAIQNGVKNDVPY